MAQVTLERDDFKPYLGAGVIKYGNDLDFIVNDGSASNWRSVLIRKPLNGSKFYSNGVNEISTDTTYVTNPLLSIDTSDPTYVKFTADLSEPNGFLWISLRVVSGKAYFEFFNSAESGTSGYPDLATTDYAEISRVLYGFYVVAGGSTLVSVYTYVPTVANEAYLRNIPADLRKYFPVMDNDGVQTANSSLTPDYNSGIFSAGASLVTASGTTTTATTSLSFEMDPSTTLDQDIIDGIKPKYILNLDGVGSTNSYKPAAKLTRRNNQKGEIDSSDPNISLSNGWTFLPLSEINSTKISLTNAKNAKFEGTSLKQSEESSFRTLRTNGTYYPSKPAGTRSLVWDNQFTSPSTIPAKGNSTTIARQDITFSTVTSLKSLKLGVFSPVSWIRIWSESFQMAFTISVTATTGQAGPGLFVSGLNVSGTFIPNGLDQSQLIDFDPAVAVGKTFHIEIHGYNSSLAPADLDMTYYQINPSGNNIESVRLTDVNTGNSYSGLSWMIWGVETYKFTEQMSFTLDLNAFYRNYPGNISLELVSTNSSSVTFSSGSITKTTYSPEKTWKFLEMSTVPSLLKVTFSGHEWVEFSDLSSPNVLVYFNYDYSAYTANSINSIALYTANSDELNTYSELTGLNVEGVATLADISTQTFDSSDLPISNVKYLDFYFDGSSIQTVNDVVAKIAYGTANLVSSFQLPYQYSFCYGGVYSITFSPSLSSDTADVDCSYSLYTYDGATTASGTIYPNTELVVSSPDIWRYYLVVNVKFLAENAKARFTGFNFKLTPYNVKTSAKNITFPKYARSLTSFNYNTVDQETPFTRTVNITNLSNDIVSSTTDYITAYSDPVVISGGTNLDLLNYQNLAINIETVNMLYDGLDFSNFTGINYAYSEVEHYNEQKDYRLTDGYKLNTVEKTIDKTTFSGIFPMSVISGNTHAEVLDNTFRLRMKSLKLNTDITTSNEFNETLDLDNCPILHLENTVTLVSGAVGDSYSYIPDHLGNKVLVVDGQNIIDDVYSLRPRETYPLRENQIGSQVFLPGFVVFHDNSFEVFVQKYQKVNLGFDSFVSTILYHDKTAEVTFEDTIVKAEVVQTVSNGLFAVIGFADRLEIYRIAYSKDFVYKVGEFAVPISDIYVDRRAEEELGYFLSPSTYWDVYSIDFSTVTISYFWSAATSPQRNDAKFALARPAAFILEYSVTNSRWEIATYAWNGGTPFNTLWDSTNMASPIDAEIYSLEPTGETCFVLQRGTNILYFDILDTSITVQSTSGYNLYSWGFNAATDEIYFFGIFGSNARRLFLPYDVTTNTILDSIAKISRDEEYLLGKITTTDSPYGILDVNGAVWVTHTASNYITVRDCNTGEILATITGLGTNPTNMARVGNFVYVANTGSSNISKVSIVSLSVVATISTIASPYGLVYTDGYLWASHDQNNFPPPALSDFVSKIDTSTDTVITTYPAPRRSRGITSSSGYIWVAGYTNHILTKIRTSDGVDVATFTIGIGPNDVVAASGNIWGTAVGETYVNVVTVSGTTNTQIPDLANSYGAFYDGTGFLGDKYVWLAGSTGVVHKASTDFNSHIADISVGDSAKHLTAVSGNIWVTDTGSLYLFSISRPESRILPGTTDQMDPSSYCVVDAIYKGVESTNFGPYEDYRVVTVLSGNRHHPLNLRIKKNFLTVSGT